MTVTHIQFRRGTAAEWVAANPILAAGEPGFETDTGKGKTGNGVTPWNLLGYVSPSVSDVSSAVKDAAGFASGANFASMFRVDDFGAAGDGSTDDTAAVQAALDAVHTAGGGIVTFTASKTYSMDGFARIYSDTEISGNGATILKPAGRSYYAAFAVLSAGATGYGSGAKNVYVHDVRVKGDLAGNSGVCLLALHHADHVTVERCVFDGAIAGGHGIDCCAVRHVVVRDCAFLGSAIESDPSEAIQVDVSRSGTGSAPDDPASYDGLPSADVTVTDCAFRSLTVDTTTYPAPDPFGSHSPTDEGTFHEDIRFVNNRVDPVQEDRSGFRGAVHFITTNRLTIRGNTFVMNGTSCAAIGLFAGGTDTPLTSVLIVDNHFDGSSGDENTLFLTFVNGLTVANNSFTNAGKTSRKVLRIASSSRLNVVGNSLEGVGDVGVQIDATCTSGLVANTFTTGFTTGVSNNSATVQLSANVDG